MDIPTRNLRAYVKEKGFNLSEMSRKTNVPYMVLYDSLLNKDRDRDLRVGEFFTVCKFIGVDPRDFAEEIKNG